VVATKKLPDREQFILNVESDIAKQIREKAKYQGIPINTYINILLAEIIHEYQ